MDSIYCCRGVFSLHFRILPYLLLLDEYVRLISKYERKGIFACKSIRVRNERSSLYTLACDNGIPTVCVARGGRATSPLTIAIGHNNRT